MGSYSIHTYMACRLQIDADADPDPAYHFDADLDPDPDPTGTFQFDADPDPQTASFEEYRKPHATGQICAPILRGADYST